MTGGAARRAFTAAGALLVLGSVPATPSAGAPPIFGGYEGTATGAGFSIAPRIPALLPVDTPIEGTASLALATLSTGDQGFGRASTFFPGTLAAGIRPLIEIGAGERLPIPDYPIVVESREFDDAHQSQLPGVTMRSDVDPDRATVLTDTGGFVIPGVADIGIVRTRSEVRIDSGRITAAVETMVDGIDLPGGGVHIDSVVSVAEAGSDAATGTCAGSVVVAGASVNGTAIVVDDAGVHVADTSLPAADAAAIADSLAAAGIELRTLGGAQSCDGPQASRSTSGLLVSLPLPSVGAVPAGRLDVIVASASADVSASPPFDLRPVAPPSRLPTVGQVLPRAPGPATGGVALPPARPAPSLDAPSPGIGAPPTATATGFAPAAYRFDGVPTPLVLGGLLATVPAARRLRRYVERLMTLVTTS